MRTFFLLIAALFIVAVFGTAQAQVNVGLHVNIGTQPIWGPTGYDHVEYYYLPDIEAYYYVPQARFYYQDGGRWVGHLDTSMLGGPGCFMSTASLDGNVAGSFRIDLRGATAAPAGGKVKG